MRFNLEKKVSVGYGYGTEIYPGTEVSLSFNANTVDDVLAQVENFLRGCGFTVDGKLAVVPKCQSQSYFTDSLYMNYSKQDSVFDNMNSIYADDTISIEEVFYGS